MIVTTTTNFGKYQTIEHLGSGGQAEVYLALEPRLQRRVAIKVLLAHLAHDPEASARFAREARLVASLRHPAIVQLFDFDTQDDQFYMVMEYLEGGSLKERLAQRGVEVAVAETDAARTGRGQDARAQACHLAGGRPHQGHAADIGHDLQPDFGVAKILGDNAQLSMAGSVVGTPAYMSPEQAGGGPVTPAADLYAPGIVLYQMLTGQVPFSGDSLSGVLMQHLQTPPPAPRTLNPSLRPAVEAVLLQALAKAPAARFASASALLAALEAAQAEETAPATEADFRRPPNQRMWPVAWSKPRIGWRPWWDVTSSPTTRRTTVVSAWPHSWWRLVCCLLRCNLWSNSSTSSPDPWRRC